MEAPYVKVRFGLWPPLLGSVLLTASTVFSVRCANGDRGEIAFAAYYHLIVLSLYWCVYLVERLPVGSAARLRAKAVVALLAAAVNATVMGICASVQELPVKIFLWVVTAAMTAYGYHVFLRDRKREAAWMELNKAELESVRTEIAGPVTDVNNYQEYLKPKTKVE